METAALIEALRRTPVIEEAQSDLKRILAEIGVDDFYFCRFPGCGRPFVAKNSSNVFCSSRCNNRWWQFYGRDKQQ